MMYTWRIQVFRNLLKKHIPLSEPSDPSYSIPKPVALCVQNVTAHIDYYIMSWSAEYDEFFALVDPLQFDNVLELTCVPISSLEDCFLCYKVYPEKERLHWKTIYNELLPYKYGIPQNN